MHLKTLFILILTILSLACKKNEPSVAIDLCQDVTCYNNGICDEGNCDCTEVYTGQFCEQEINPCDGIIC